MNSLKLIQVREIDFMRNALKYDGNTMEIWLKYNGNKVEIQLK